MEDFCARAWNARLSQVFGSGNSELEETTIKMFPPLPNTIDGACWALRLISDGEVSVDFPSTRLKKLANDSVWKILVNGGYAKLETEEEAHSRRYSDKNQRGCGCKLYLTPLGIELLDEAWSGVENVRVGKHAFNRNELLTGLDKIGPGAVFREHGSVANRA